MGKRTEVPELIFSYSVETNPEGGFYLNGKIEQLNTDFVFVVGIYYISGGENKVVKQLVTTKEHKFRLKVSSKPTKVKINKYLELMCKVKTVKERK